MFVLSTLLLVAPAAYNEEFRTTLGDKRLQELLLSIDSAPNREQVRHICLQEHQEQQNSRRPVVQ
jgi:hypothetical protein